MDVQEASVQIRGTTLRIRVGDMTKTGADVLVCSEDSRLSMTLGLSKALVDVGGPAIRLDAQKHLPCSIGDVVVASAGALPAKYIVHIVTIDYIKLEFASEADIRFMATRCLEVADALGAKSIAFPTLGIGATGFPIDAAVKIILEVIGDYLEGETHLVEVILVLYEKEYVPDAGPEGIQQVYHKAVELATEISQCQRAATLLIELDKLLKVSGLPAELAQIRQEADAVESALAALRGHVAKLVQLDGARKAAAGKDAESEAQPRRPEEGIEPETLRKELSRLSEDELQMVASDLFGYANDVLNTGTRTQQLLSLLAHLYNRRMIGELLKWLERNRPDIAKDLPPLTPSP